MEYLSSVSNQMHGPIGAACDVPPATATRRACSADVSIVCVELDCAVFSTHAEPPSAGHASAMKRPRPSVLCLKQSGPPDMCVLSLLLWSDWSSCQPCAQQ